MFCKNLSSFFVICAVSLALVSPANADSTEQVAAALKGKTLILVGVKDLYTKIILTGNQNSLTSTVDIFVPDKTTPTYRDAHIDCDSSQEISTTELFQLGGVFNLKVIQEQDSCSSLNYQNPLNVFEVSFSDHSSGLFYPFIRAHSITGSKHNFTEVGYVDLNKKTCSIVKIKRPGLMNSLIEKFVDRSYLQCIFSGNATGSMTFKIVDRD